MEVKETDVLTTGKVAGLLKVSQQTVIRMFDKEHLQGFRAGKHRRIFVWSVVKWARSNSIDMDGLEVIQTEGEQKRRTLIDLAELENPLAAIKQAVSEIQKAARKIEQASSA